MRRFNVDASLKRDKRFEEEMEALQREMSRRDKLLAAASAANQNTSDRPSRGIVTSRGNDIFTPTGSFFGQQSQQSQQSPQPNLMDEPDFFTQAGSKKYQDWPAVSAPLPAELAGLKVPSLGTGTTQPLQSTIPKQTAQAFTESAKAGLLNDLNKGGKSRRRSAKKAKRSRRSASSQKCWNRMKALRSRKARRRYMMTV
jgi:hypothetical protein